MLLAGSLGLSAETPVTYFDAQFSGISPNGRYAISELYGIVTIYDFVNEDQFTYGEDTYSYAGALGNCVSDNGVVLGSTNNNNDAAYWKDGEWFQLSVPDPSMVCSSNGVTPDGTRICGGVGLAAMSVEEDNLMIAPAYWDVQADGTFGEYHLLPYPDVDFTGRVPQYVTAVYISENGKTIIGQVADYSGQVYEPIVYNQNEDGEWSYTLPLKELFTPKTPLPEFPGDGPAEPDPTEFMSAEQAEAYEAAYEAWQLSGYQYDLYPEAIDYLSGDEVEKYNAAKAEYEVEFAEWMEKTNAYYDAFYEIMETIPVFEFNSIGLTPDGKSYIANAIEEEFVEDSWWPITNYVPWIINTGSSNEYKALKLGTSLAVNSVANNEVFFGCNGLNEVPQTGYIIQGDSCQNIYDYIIARDPELKDWMEENMVHEIESMDENWNPIFETYAFTGFPRASADLSTLLLHCTNYWYDSPEGYVTTFGYKFELPEVEAGVCAPGAVAKNEVAFDAAGNLSVGADVVALEIYDLSGRLVFKASNPGSTVATTLASGVYVVKTVNADGSAAAAKLAK